MRPCAILLIMPGRNVTKEYAAESFYHIYNRGVNKNNVFLDHQDRITFLRLLKRYLGKKTEKKKNSEIYPNYCNEIELLAFCLMNNHFHLFVYQEPETAIAHFMKSLTVAYSMYFNKKYKRVGAVFQQRYRGVRVTDDSQYLHISRYIHMNPKDYENYEWSSLPYYLDRKHSDWVKPERIVKFFNKNEYLAFLREYADRRDELTSIKDQLANS